MPNTPLSSVRDIVWPAIAAGQGSALLGTAFQLEQSQWWSARELQIHQRRQLVPLLEHALAHVPYYRRRFDEIGLTAGEALSPGGWLKVPLLTRQDIRDQQAHLKATEMPSGHGETFLGKTSGSTGEPLEVLRTEVTGFFWESLALRDIVWHDRDLGGRLLAIRSGRHEPDPLAVLELPDWGLFSPEVFETGPMTLFYHLTPLARQAELLEEHSPHYLLTYPSNARALCRHARSRPVRLPDLRAVHTYGEPLTPDVRAACRDTWGVPVHDVYSSEELGFIALQCPLHDRYHVQSESVLVEILDEEGLPCSPGQIGRVVLTSLHGFAMPLIRYSIGDYAEVGEACPCGRGLPVLERILGRRRNQVALPDGRRAWPDIDAIWAAIPGATQIQLVQLGLDHVEVRFVRAEPLSPAEEQAITRSIHQALGHPFPLTFAAEETIARQPNGKYETFIDAR